MNFTGIFLPSRKSYESWAPFYLRIALGIGFVMHGYAKLARGPEGFAKLLEQSHVPIPKIMAWLATLTEFFGGIALILGLFVSLVSIPLIITMVMAVITVQFKFGFSSVRTIGLNAEGPIFAPPGYEINLVYIAALICLIIIGAGKLSLDSIWSKQVWN